MIEEIRKKYDVMQARRAIIWKQLDENFKHEWFVKRPTMHQWSIDEILRHMLANEIRYLQMPFDENVQIPKIALRAQWVGNILFRLEEQAHQALDVVKNAFKEVELASRDILEKATDDDLGIEAKAPWGEILTRKDLVLDLVDHDNYHRGQVQFLITFFRGPPEFKEPPKNVSFG